MFLVGTAIGAAWFTVSLATLEGTDVRFPASHHLRTGRDFAKVYAAKLRASCDLLLVYGLPNERSHSRIGLSVSRKNGNAVRRNLIKRRLREAYRLHQKAIAPGLDLILIPRPGTDPSVEQYGAALVRHSRTLAHRTQRRKRDK